jgi:L-rhamnose mutarotase
MTRILPGRIRSLVRKYFGKCHPLFPIECRRTVEEAMPRYCLALDLKDDATAIAEYKRYHQKIWPEIRDSISGAGIVDMEIYLLGTRLFMIMDVDETFSLSAKAAADAANPRVQEWEALMGRFQQPLPQSRPGQRWVGMERIFSLQEQKD